VDLNVSFRSTDAVLRAVDAVFAHADARHGVVIAEGDDVRHEPVRAGDAGLVELWPPVAPADSGDPEPWAPPIQRRDDAPPSERLARLIATRIQRWTRTDDPTGWLPARDRQMRPGDVLILVRRRDAFLTAMVRALKTLDVPVAGADRMVLTEQLAVQDLVALGNVLLLPEDDLSLACVLKGPLIGLGETALFDLAHGRSGRLWDALRDRAGERGDFEDAYHKLAGWLARADAVPPYELYARLLGAEGGRAALLARLGPEAAEPIDEFLALALTHEREHVPSLQGFLHWLGAGGQEIKRDPEHGSDAVRVMTVHGAKGLQAPVVILPDTTRAPLQRHGLFWTEAPEVVLWSPSKARDAGPLPDLRAAAETAQEQETRRLLYVAMTRAEDRLHVGGWLGKTTPSAPTWYDLIAQGLKDVAEPCAFDFTADISDGWQGEGYRLETPQRRPVDARADTMPATGGVDPLPDWARHAPGEEPAPPRPLAPSRAPETEPPARSPLDGGDPAGRYRRGRIIHRLLQTLPDVAPAERRAAGARLLASPLYRLDDDAIAALLDEVLGVIAHPEAAELFGPNSRAEVPVVGVSHIDGRPEPVAGQVDRMLVRPDRVVVVDYKTNRPPPRTTAEVPEVYRRQLAIYRDLLSRIYPDRPVATWLLWTETARLMQISDARGAGGSG
jgi:ATP-dependent helicase/nuclease subunit A